MVKKVFLYLVVSSFILNLWQFFILNSSAGVRWGTNGVGVVTNTVSGGSSMITDGTGGIIVTWSDTRSDGNGDIYCQKLNSSGVAQWGSGVVVCNKNDGLDPTQEAPSIASDGNGGAIIVWRDYRNSGVSLIDLYAQRISSSGVPQWTTNGILISDGDGNTNQTQQSIISDGVNGAIIVWRDNRTDTGDIYAKRIDGNGNIVSGWGGTGNNGIVVCNAANQQTSSTIVSDEASGAIIVWIDKRTDPNGDIYAVRLDSSGNVASGWTANGTVVCNAPAGGTGNSTQTNPVIVSDGVNGSIIAWLDNRNDTNSDIYVQRVDSSGNLQWGSDPKETNGVLVCTISGAQSLMKISSSSGGVVISWRDNARSYYMYAQRINSSGVVQWSSDGIQISSIAAISTGGYGNSITDDGAGGSIILWNKDRGNIYAQRIDVSGNLMWGSGGVLIASISDPGGSLVE